MTPLFLYSVAYETRERGALGRFEWQWREVRAASPETAAALVGEAFRRRYETRGGPIIATLPEVPRYV